jgi:tetratricopeptide (TPR) repeat protein
MSETNSFQTYLKASIDWSAKNQKLLLYVFAGVLVVAIATTIYLRFDRQQAESLSFELNELIDEVVETRAKIEAGEGEYEDLSALSQSIYELYQNNQSRVNGLRALWVYAQILTLLDEHEKAAESYELLYTSKKSHYLADQALLYAAIENENLGNNEKAYELLSTFQKQYPASPFYGEALLSLSRLYVLEKNYSEAEALLEEIKANPNLSSYVQAADELLSSMQILDGYKSQNQTSPAVNNSLPDLNSSLQLQ